MKGGYNDNTQRTDNFNDDNTRYHGIWRLERLEMNKKYYHFEDDLQKFPDAWLFAVWSKRGPGKTYSSLWYAYDNKIKFTYHGVENGDNT